MRRTYCLLLVAAIAAIVAVAAVASATDIGCAAAAGQEGGEVECSQLLIVSLPAVQNPRATGGVFVCTGSGRNETSASMFWRMNELFYLC